MGRYLRLFEVRAHFLISCFSDAFHRGQVIGTLVGARGDDPFRQHGSDPGDALERFARGGVDVEPGAEGCRLGRGVAADGADCE